MFSGEDQIHTIVANPSLYGVGMLVVLAILKLLLMKYCNSWALILKNLK